MKQMKLALTSLISLFLIFLAFSSASAYPLYADAGAYIDYDFIDISFSGTGDVTGTSFLSTAGITGEDTSRNSVEAILESADGTFFAWGETNIEDASMDYQDISAFAGIYGTDAYGYGQATAGYFGQFQAQTSGTLTISLDYYLYSMVEAGAGQTVTSDASVFLTINGLQTSDSLSFTAVDGEWYGYETDWETLTLSLFLDAGDTVDFSIQAIADTIASPVPVPSAVWLLGIGFAGLWTTRKSRKPRA